jgi:hypothetical protein
MLFYLLLILFFGFSNIKWNLVYPTLKTTVAQNKGDFPFLFTSKERCRSIT